MGSTGGIQKMGGAGGKGRGQVRLTCNTREMRREKKRGKGGVQRNNHEHRRMRQIQV